MAKFKLISFSKEIPKRFKIVNWFILLPIILWPLVFFGSIFIFDNPKSITLAYILFILINSYPIFLFLLFEFNARIYQNNKMGGYIIPIAILGMLSFGFLKEYASIKKNDAEFNIKKQKRIQEGYIGICDSYKIKNDTIYYKNTIINGDPNTFEYISCHLAKDKTHVYSTSEIIRDCDPKTFEKINPKWQKDKNYYFNGGLAMKHIDYHSFEILEANYSKDKNNVYYYIKILENADPNTFKVNRMTHIGTDKNNSYKHGHIITNH